MASLGLAPITANATNSVGLWPGSLTGALGYRDYFQRTKHVLKLLWLPTILGSATGAFLLTRISNRQFDHAVPFLIVIASILLFFQGRLQKMLANRPYHLGSAIGVILQFLVATYGGFFGAGMGIMMLGAFGLYVEGDLNELNAVKNWLAVLINLVGSSILITQGLVKPLPALALVLGGLAGGYFSANWAKKLPQQPVRIAIGIYGLLMAAYFVAKLLSTS